jgi:hypothetical protein
MSYQAQRLRCRHDSIRSTGNDHIATRSPTRTPITGRASMATAMTRQPPQPSATNGVGWNGGGPAY